MNDFNQRARIRGLNDLLRRHGIGGKVTITAGLAALDQAQITRVLDSVRGFDTFTPANDPYGEHDCATLTVGADRFIWKIAYYDTALAAHSPDPSDPNVTARVLTVMLADEY